METTPETLFENSIRHFKDKFLISCWLSLPLMISFLLFYNEFSIYLSFKKNGINYWFFCIQFILSLWTLCRFKAALNAQQNTFDSKTIDYEDLLTIDLPFQAIKYTVYKTLLLKVILLSIFFVFSNQIDYISNSLSIFNTGFPSLLSIYGFLVLAISPIIYIINFVIVDNKTNNFLDVILKSCQLFKNTRRQLYLSMRYNIVNLLKYLIKEPKFLLLSILVPSIALYGIMYSIYPYYDAPLALAGVYIMWSIPFIFASLLISINIFTFSEIYSSLSQNSKLNNHNLSHKESQINSNFK